MDAGTGRDDPSRTHGLKNQTLCLIGNSKETAKRNCKSLDAKVAESIYIPFV